MYMAFLAQMRQSNKCGSVWNDDIFNLHLGSGVGPLVIYDGIKSLKLLIEFLTVNQDLFQILENSLI